MNRNCYRLVFNARLGMRVPQAETARGRGKAPGTATLGVVAGCIFMSLAAQAAPIAGTGTGMPSFVTYGQATFQQAGNKSVISQVGNKSILNWKSFNVGAGESVQFQQVTGTGSNTLVPGASFTSLNRIWDANPSVISGSITQAPGQQANVILVNNNGIAFMGGSQVNLNSFTATSLNIADKYIVNGLLGDLINPQFVADDPTKGFVKVFEGAQITAGSQGRVMLIAPTVVNRGTITAPDGQVILAAGTRAYLRANDDGNLNLRGLLIEVDSPAGLSNFTTANTSVPSALANAGDDLLGNATNIGTVSTPRGNITMVGYAVNQKGVASATTSVVSNGSIYLMAKDTQTINGSSVGSTRAGQVVLGPDSTTQVSIDTADATTSIDNANLGKTGLDKASEVNVLGSSIYMASGAKMVVPAGKVTVTALDDPSTATSPLNPTLRPSDQASTAARVHIASGATIDVAGLDAVEVSVARNTVELELRGDELKDSPVNRNGALRGQKVYLDVEKALANAAAGKSTLIANDSLLAYQNKLERTAAERATTGGSISIRSQGETIIESGAAFDVSGGSVKYTAANVQRTLLSANGKLVDLVDATADTYYIPL
jgi:filamentous hemagglutinin family protein